MPDSNRLPLPCHGSALPIELMALIFSKSIINKLKQTVNKKFKKHFFDLSVVVSISLYYNIYYTFCQI
ncbi:MAG: hypothetical protein US15_C0041G0001 [Candidatus Moranbacteria bacterium GW2011_GWF1_36_4]|nr:MAG: hypothetical protein US15_C0041G0001 [Candidatus Moranbacteria bacterium GW2011_GWF1_36_4]